MAAVYFCECQNIWHEWRNLQIHRDGHTRWNLDFVGNNIFALQQLHRFFLNFIFYFN